MKQTLKKLLEYKNSKLWISYRGKLNVKKTYRKCFNTAKKSLFK